MLTHIVITVLPNTSDQCSPFIANQISHTCLSTKVLPLGPHNQDRTSTS